MAEQIGSANDVYDFMKSAIAQCELHHVAVAEDLSAALLLGSSNLEILGAIAMILRREKQSLVFLDQERIDAIIEFVRRACES